MQKKKNSINYELYRISSNKRLRSSKCPPSNKGPPTRPKCETTAPSNKRPPPPSPISLLNSSGIQVAAAPKRI